MSHQISICAAKVQPFLAWIPNFQELLVMPRQVLNCTRRSRSGWFLGGSCLLSSMPYCPQKYSSCTLISHSLDMYLSNPSSREKKVQGQFSRALILNDFWNQHASHYINTQEIYSSSDKGEKMVVDFRIGFEKSATNLINFLWNVVWKVSGEKQKTGKKLLNNWFDFW